MSFDESGSGDEEVRSEEGNDGAPARGGRESGGSKQDDGDQQADAKKDGDDDKSKKPRSKKPLIILAIIVVVVAVIGFFYWFLHRNEVNTDDAYTDGNTVTMVPKVSGYVTALYVDDNTRVKQGDLLVRIDARDYRTALAQAEAQLELAQAELVSAQTALRIARVQYPAQLVSARAQQEAAAANAAQADAQSRRLHEVDRRATTQENIDTATSQQRSGTANLRGAEAQVAIASLVPEQIDEAAATVQQRQAQVAQARAQLDQARLNLGYTEIRAPVDGFVAMRSVQYGSYVTAGQSMFILVTPEVWVTANFKESQIGRMRIGDRVDLEVDAYSALKLHGHVQSIQYGSGAKFTAFPAENATGNYVKIVQRIPVKIVIDDGLDPNRPLPLGLSVTPDVHFP